MNQVDVRLTLTMKCPAIHNEELRVEWVIKPTIKPSE
jgi:hypothetical protein